MDTITNNRNYVLMNADSQPMAVINTEALEPDQILAKLQEALSDEFDAEVTINEITDVEYGFKFEISVSVLRDGDDPYDEVLTLDNIAIY